MDGSKVHYELFVRRTPGAPWILDMAGEGRSTILEAAEAMLEEGRVAAVRVSKETLDEETREFKSVTILSKGQVEAAKQRKVVENTEPLCVSPADIYTAHARDRIGRLLEGFLGRHQATPFELLHRPDLVERLEASGTELQHAIQKVAVPEAQARGLSTHELMRSFQALAERSIERVMKDHRRGAFPNLNKETFAAAAERLSDEAERCYLLGAGVAATMGNVQGWADKVGCLLDLADTAPKAGPGRRLAFEVLEQPLAEILESRAGMADLLGPDLDLGRRLAAMTRLAAREAVELLIRIEPTVARTMPPLEGSAIRLAQWLEQPPFAAARSATARRILRELKGPRRLCPNDPSAEIELLRALAMALTAASGQTLPLEDVEEAFAVRSRMLVSSEFVEAFMSTASDVREEAEWLIRLVENVIGAANKRQAGRYLAAHVGSLRFEKDFHNGPDLPAAKLAALAGLQKAAGRAGLVPEDLAPIKAKLGELGGLIEAEAHLCTALIQSPAPVMHRLTLLLKLAMGEAGPMGPAADRARHAAMKLLKSDNIRAELAAVPEQLVRVRDLLQAAGMAA